MQKNVFFYIRAIYSSFWYWYPNPGYHHEKAQVLSFPKMSYFLGVGVSKGELLLLKVNRLWNFGSVSKIKRCCKKKTRPQFWVFGPAIESALGKPTFFRPDSMLALKTQNCGCDFFVTFFWPPKKIEKILNFDRQYLHFKNCHTQKAESWGCALSHGSTLYRVLYLKIFSNSRFSFPGFLHRGADIPCKNSEFGRLSLFIVFFALFHNVWHRYASK